MIGVGLAPGHEVVPGSEFRVPGFHLAHEAVQVLIDLANLRGGPDNITVAIARVERGGKAPGHPLGRWLRSLGGRGQG